MMNPIPAAWQALTCVGLGLENPSNRDLFKRLISQPDFAWGTLIEQAMFHKMYAMLGAACIEEDLFPLLPPFINHQIIQAYQVNKTKNDHYRDEVLRLTHLLTQAGVRHALTKGIVLQDELYHGDGGRFLSDIDFMIPPDQKSSFTSVLLDAGYVVGELDWRKQKIRPLSREERLWYLTTNDHVPPLYIEKEGLTGPLSVGCSMSFTWSGCGFQLPIEAAFAQLGTYTSHVNPELHLPVMLPEYHFLYIVLHLYKHAWLPSMLRRSNDVNLIKFVDVYRYHHTHKARLHSHLPALLEQHQVLDPLVWVTEHTDRVLGTHITEAFGWNGKVTEAYLHSAGALDGSFRPWKGNMTERLLTRDRNALFEDAAGVPQ